MPGKRFQMADLVSRGKPDDDGARARLTVGLDPVDNLIPAAHDTKHGLGNGVVGLVVILGEKPLSL